MKIKYIDRELAKTIEFYDVDFMFDDMLVKLRVKSEKGKVSQWYFADSPHIAVWQLSEGDKKEIESQLADNFEL